MSSPTVCTLYRIPFTVIIDHKPLVPLYNHPIRTALVRVDCHRIKLQGFDLKVQYLPGNKNPSDDASRHPLPLESPSDEEAEEPGELHLNAIIAENLPVATSLELGE